MFALVDIVVYIQLMPQIGDASCLRKTPDILSIHMDECHSYQVIVNVCVCVCAMWVDESIGKAFIWIPEQKAARQWPSNRAIKQPNLLTKGFSEKLCQK